MRPSFTSLLYSKKDRDRVLTAKQQAKKDKTMEQFAHTMEELIGAIIIVRLVE